MNRNRSVATIERIAFAKRVPCRSYPRGCGAPVGVECTSTVDGPQNGQPLGGFGVHVDRYEDAVAAMGPGRNPRNGSAIAAPVPA